ncbi:MAG: ATP-binding cassette domain-containing protein [Clostridiales bacterium]|jgi:ABC-2 type transport system ATP-binding protein|nr:ATP-binding cassette domain-containing protein [Clostridiales bacterium]
MVLEVSGLQKLYRNGRGVSEMAFSLGRGDVFGLLGANGSGKTTAMKAICGLCPYKGEVRIFGQPARDNAQNAMKKVGCIVDAPAFYGYLSAQRNLELAARYCRIDGARERIEEVLGAVGLLRQRRDLAEKFSLGMKARLGLALCMLSSPELMVLDEPLNGLDIEGMADIRSIILRSASETGATFLISSHLASEIEKTCNRVGVMHEGALLETAPMASVLEEYNSVEDYFLSVVRLRRGQSGQNGPSGPSGRGSSWPSGQNGQNGHNAEGAGI